MGKASVETRFEPTKRINLELVELRAALREWHVTKLSVSKIQVDTPLGDLIITSGSWRCDNAASFAVSRIGALLTRERLTLDEIVAAPPAGWTVTKVQSVVPGAEDIITFRWRSDAARVTRYAHDDFEDLVRSSLPVLERVKAHRAVAELLMMLRETWH